MSREALLAAQTYIRNRRTATNPADVLRMLDTALSQPAVEDAEGWSTMETLPSIGRKFVGLWRDGSGAKMFWRHDAGFIDNEGDDFRALNDIELWTYLPDDFDFLCETGEEPMMLRLLPIPTADVTHAGEGK